VGDLTGFAAAVYRRGIPFVQIPTTLLAAVDSSVGGKTAVNLAAGKNLAGAFWQPSLVICDPETHKTLKAEEYANGVAESIKHGVLFDAKLFAAHETGTFSADTARWIAVNVAHKRDIVLADERESGVRKLLNFGHTLGHAVERAGHYQIPHGAAVAIGMACICRLRGFAEITRLENTLQKNHLPTQCPYPRAQLAQFLAQDKKRQGGDITLVVPQKIGRAHLHTMPLADFQKELEAPDTMR
jgi:3-dehydroquinate synthase